MNTLVAIMIGAIAAAGIYCLLRRSLVKLVIGIALLSQAVNLLVFSASGLNSSKAPLIAPSAKVLGGGTADPLPQALVLTAVVIGFGLISFCLALVYQTYKSTGHDDIDSIRNTDT